MKNSIKITSLCLIGCLYTTVGLADDKKAIWGTDGQAITKKPIPVQTIKPKTEAQINPKVGYVGWGIAISDTAPQINPKPQTNAMSGMGGMSGKNPQINPKPQIKPKQQTVKDAKISPKIKEKTPAATPINLPKPIPAK